MARSSVNTYTPVTMVCVCVPLRVCTRALSHHKMIVIPLGWNSHAMLSIYTQTYTHTQTATHHQLDTMPVYAIHGRAVLLIMKISAISKKLASSNTQRCRQHTRSKTPSTRRRHTVKHVRRDITERENTKCEIERRLETLRRR